MRFSKCARVAVVIPVHNGLEFTKACLKSLHNNDAPECVLVVVDDGSTDGTAEYLCEHEPNVEIVRGDANLWWSGAVNAGCDRALGLGATRLILLNNDNCACSNLISDLDRCVDSMGGCVSAVAVTRDADATMRIVQAGGRLDWRGRGISRIGTGIRFAPSEELVDCDWLPGAALAFDRDVYVRLGGFDRRRFPQYRGDVDFTVRARRAGFRCSVSHASWVVNDGTQTGLDVTRPVSLRMFVRGFFTLRSNYNIREALPFALAHCPPRLVLRYLAQFYARYTYACLKSRFPGIARLPALMRGASE